MIPVIATVAEVRAAVQADRESGRRVGFVPTMGALHDGHAHLIRAARAETGCVVVSIFVNPTQFGPAEDYQRYPRTLDDDRAVCAQEGAGLIFAPAPDAMYPHGPASTYVEVPRLSTLLEGARRPGHFRGVATVVLKLFEIVRPDVAYFGAKDYQQQLMIRRLVDDLNLPVAVRTVATVRAADGLALSSRNRYLDPEQRQAATVLYRALGAARAVVAGGERRGDRVRQVLQESVESERLARLDYAAVADADSLEPLDVLEPGRRAVGLLAVWVGTTRLIDNALLTDESQYR